MRYVKLYLIGYALLVGGAVVALWRGGVFSHIPGLWIGLALSVAAAFGVLLAVACARSPVAPDR